MPPGPDQQRLNPEERANLVAYIDGELTENEARHLSTKLTQSPTARREVEQLKKTWELLEHLSPPRLSPEFSERTLTKIRTVDAGRPMLSEKTLGWASAGAKWGSLIAAAIASLVVGYGISWVLWPDPARRIVQDLSIAENLDEYLEVGSAEFLEQLAGSSEFGKGSP